MEQEPWESFYPPLSDRQKSSGLVHMAAFWVVMCGGAALLAREGATARARWRRALLLSTATLMALYGTLTVLGYVLARFLVGEWERRATTRARLRSAYGTGYERVASSLYEDLVRLDPFRHMYSLGGKRREYQRLYWKDVDEVLSAVDEEQPTSEKQLRAIIFRALAADPYGNRRGDVGDEKRYTRIARRLWKVLREEGKDSGRS